MAKKKSNDTFSQSSGRYQETVDVSSVDYTAVNTVRGIFVDVAGVVAGRLVDDDVDSSWTLVAGVTHGLVFSVIRHAGTTATGIKLVG